jgi:hypothetical protein
VFRIIRGVIDYSIRIGLRWILLLFLAIDIIALVSQVFIPQLILPAWAYALVFMVGLFLAAYQEHKDLIALLPTTPTPPPPYELLPTSYEFSLRPDVSTISVWFNAVNYQGRDLILENVTVASLQLSGGPTFHDIQHPGVLRIPARQSRPVRCHRGLADGEVRALAGKDLKNRTNADVYVAASARSGWRSLYVDTSRRNVYGWFSGTLPDLA